MIINWCQISEQLNIPLEKITSKFLLDFSTNLKMKFGLVHTMMAYGWSRYVDPLINLGTRWSWVAKFTPWTPKSFEKPVPVESKAIWDPEMFRTFWERKNSVLLSRHETLSSNP